jgi:hypothetical protein
LFEAFDADRAGLFGFAHLHGLDFLVEGMRQSIGFGENLVIFDIERQSLILTPSYEYMFDNALFSSFEGTKDKGSTFLQHLPTLDLFASSKAHSGYSKKSCKTI